MSCASFPMPRAVCASSALKTHKTGKAMPLEKLTKALPEGWASKTKPAPGVDLKDQANDKTW
jgi:hypothetical protein